MKRVLLFMASVCVVVVLVAYCFADLPGPGPHPRPYPYGVGAMEGPTRYVDPSNAVWLTIEAADIEEPTLEIPQKMRSKAVKVATNSQGTNRLASVPAASGAILTLCLFGGVFLVPGRGRKATVCAAGLIAIGGLLFALREPNAAAEPPPAVIGKPIALPAGLFIGDVHVTFTESGEAIRLRLPRKKLPELAKQLKETPR